MTQQLKQARLGRGLSALLGDYAGARNAIDDTGCAAGEGAKRRSALAASEIAIDRIVPESQAAAPHLRRDRSSRSLPNRSAPRACSRPILVRPDPSNADMFEIIAGERRWRAARRAGLTAIPAVVRAMDDREVLEIAIIENVQRADLNPVEEAEAYKALIDRFGRTQESVATQVGKSREHVSNTLRLLNLPDDVREHVREGRLTAGHARALLKTKDPSALAAIVISQRPLGARHRGARQGRQERQREARRHPSRRTTTRTSTPRRWSSTCSARSGSTSTSATSTARAARCASATRKLEQLDEICRLLSRPRIVTAGESRTDALD